MIDIAIKDKVSCFSTISTLFYHVDKLVGDYLCYLQEKIKEIGIVFILYIPNVCSECSFMYIVHSGLQYLCTLDPLLYAL